MFQNNALHTVAVSRGGVCVCLFCFCYSFTATVHAVWYLNQMMRSQFLLPEQKVCLYVTVCYNTPSSQDIQSKLCSSVNIPLFLNGWHEKGTHDKTTHLETTAGGSWALLVLVS